MKVKVLLNRIETPYQNDFNKASTYFIKHGIPIEWEFEQSNITGYKTEVENFGSVGTRIQLIGHQSQITLSSTEITVFAFNGDEFPLQDIPASKCELFPTGVLVTLMTYKEGIPIDENYTVLIHEMMHALNKQLSFQFSVFVNDPMDIMFRNGQWLPYYKNNQPDVPDGNFAQAWANMGPYLSKFNQSTMNYKYFKPNEIVGLQDSLISVLDIARGLANTPFNITSGYRTAAQNKKADGVSDSAHTRGLAVDLSCTDMTRTSILRGLLTCGTPVFIEIAGKHVHIDVDASIHPMGMTIWENDPS